MKNTKNWQIIIICTLLFILFSLSGCTDTYDDPKLPQRGFFMGITPLPADGQPLDEVFRQSAETCECITFGSELIGANKFWEFPTKIKSSTGKTFLNQYTRGNDMFPLIRFSFIDKDEQGNLILQTPDSISDATLNNPEWRALYKQSVLEVVSFAKPSYLATGNEVNRWFETYGSREEDPNGFHHFISLHNEIYDAVKEISPETKIFPIFSREIVSENREANLSVLPMFDSDKINLLTFTTYPIAVQGINKPSDIPLNYYQKASEYMPDKLFGFSEIGWPTYNTKEGEQFQSDFLINLSTTLTTQQDINLHLFNYAWLHDVNEEMGTGLIKRDGTKKIGYTTWMHISNSTLLWHQQENEQIVFVSKADSDEGELYLLDKNNKITRLTNNNRYENNPALSFDGKKIAFHAGQSNDLLSYEIYILDLETGEETQLTDNNVLDGHPDWSPDNKHLVYASFQDNLGQPAGVANLYIIDINGTIVSQLTNNEWEDNDPEWSPDGTKIVFKSTRNTQIDAREEIYVMNSDGTNVQRLTTTTSWESDHDPSWNPDSSTVAFMHYSGSRPWTDLVNLNVFINHWDELTPWNTYLVDLNENRTQVTTTDQIAQLAVFSKNGEKILYLDNEFILINDKLRGIHHRYTIINTDGTKKQQLLPDDRHTPTVEYFDW